MGQADGEFIRLRGCHDQRDRGISSQDIVCGGFIGASGGASGVWELSVSCCCRDVDEGFTARRADLQRNPEGREGQSRMGGKAAAGEAGPGITKSDGLGKAQQPELNGLGDRERSLMDWGRQRWGRNG